MFMSLNKEIKNDSISFLVKNMYYSTFWWQMADVPTILTQ